MYFVTSFDLKNVSDYQPIYDALEKIGYLQNSSSDGEGVFVFPSTTLVKESNTDLGKEYANVESAIKNVLKSDQDIDKLFVFVCSTWKGTVIKN